FVFAVLGTALSYFATSFLVLLIGQILIGIGCAPAFLGCLVFISKHFAPERFAALSGLVLGLGGIGMLITATPLALVAEAWSWRGAFVILSFAGVFATAACFALVDDRSSPGVPAESVFQSVCLVGVLLKRRGTAGILLLGSVCYASVLTFRGLWIVPFLSERHSLSLVQSSNVVFVLSISMIISPFFFGFVDPGGRNRRLLIVASAVAMAIATLWLGFAYTESLGMSVIVITLIGVISGFTILQYADVRSSYEPAVIGRALSLLNMSTFIGVAVVQSIVATVGDFAILAGANAIEWIFSSLTILLVSGCIGFCLLPSPSSQIEKVEN
ncbi:MAG: MFS transporter, partial [Afipia sp.]|nr:MFS transporter [Afipia sp.]